MMTTLPTNPTGGAERRHRRQEPGRYDGGREEACQAGSRECRFFFRPLPVSAARSRAQRPSRPDLTAVVCPRRADLFEDEEIKGLLKFQPWWTTLKPSGEQEGGAGESQSQRVCLVRLLSLFDSFSV